MKNKILLMLATSIVAFVILGLGLIFLYSLFTMIKITLVHPEALLMIAILVIASIIISLLVIWAFDKVTESWI